MSDYISEVAFDVRLRVPAKDLERAVDAIEGVAEAEGWGITFPAAQGLLARLDDMTGGVV